MSRRAVPLQFLVLVVGGWIGFRVIALTPSWWVPAESGGTAELAERGLASRPAFGSTPSVIGPSVIGPSAIGSRAMPPPPTRRLEAFAVAAVPSTLGPSLRSPGPMTSPAVAMSRAGIAPLAPFPTTSRWPVFAPPPAAPSFTALSQPVDQVGPPALATLPVPQGARRLAGSAFVYLRGEGRTADLAPGGTLGGSQAGARLTYRLNGDPRRPLAVSARAYLPIERPQGAEVAVGVDWQPVARLPIHLLAERRERVGREGRSDFALTVYGGGERRLAGGRIRVDAYGQAGVVGVRTRDLFADGAARATVAVGPVDAGAGVWGGAQPGAARLDVGPHVSTRLPIAAVNVRLAAEWRFRIAGEAAPSSGPALTLATDF